jgi:N-acetylmuramoyl-L-alanine amidase
MVDRAGMSRVLRDVGLALAVLIVVCLGVARPAIAVDVTVDDDAVITGSVPPTPPLAASAVATGARFAGDSAKTRLVVDLTEPVAFTAFTLADPYRLVIDLPQVTFRLPAGSGQGARGLVQAFRHGLVMPGASRIVVDLAEPARIDRAFLVAAQNGDPARLVVDLARVDRDTFLRLLTTENRVGVANAPSRADPAPRRDPVRRGAGSDPRPLIVIDPGHGGIDSGTVSGGVAEKEIVFDFAQVLRTELEKGGRYRLLMTRTEDRFIPLDERVAIARRAEADLFISVHANALSPGEGEARGAIIFTLSDDASDADAARMAERENKSDAIAGLDLSRAPDDIADILIDLTRRETMGFSHQFAKLLIQDMRQATRMHRTPHKSAGFRVLRAPDVPSVLVELGFVTSPADLKMLTSDAWRLRTAQAMAVSVHTFFAPRLAAGRSQR